MPADTILAAAGVSKGALYYHFNSKEALGYAVVEECSESESDESRIRNIVDWVRSLRSMGNRKRG